MLVNPCQNPPLKKERKTEKGSNHLSQLGKPAVFENKSLIFRHNKIWKNKRKPNPYVVLFPKRVPPSYIISEPVSKSK